MAALDRDGLVLQTGDILVVTQKIVSRAEGQVFSFAFGKDSFARHRGEAPLAAVIRRPGLAIDVDTPDDLAIADAFGFRTPA